MIQESHSLLLYSMHMLNLKKIIITKSVYFIVPSGKKNPQVLRFNLTTESFKWIYTITKCTFTLLNQLKPGLIREKRVQIKVNPAYMQTILWLAILSVLNFYERGSLTTNFYKSPKAYCIAIPRVLMCVHVCVYTVQKRFELSNLSFIANSQVFFFKRKVANSRTWTEAFLIELN